MNRSASDENMDPSDIVMVNGIPWDTVHGIPWVPPYVAPRTPREKYFKIQKVIRERNESIEFLIRENEKDFNKMDKLLKKNKVVILNGS